MALKWWEFKFWLPKPPEGEVVGMSEAEYERMLLLNLANAKEHPFQAMWELAHFYKNQGRVDEAMNQFRALLDRTPDLEAKSRIILGLGQTSEKARDFEMAVGFYQHALAMEPTDPFTDYFIQNNLGYSLLQLSRFDEAEEHCRQAIRIDPSRPNGFKNLGLSLQGQGRLTEAAESYIKATQANASDDRSLRHLEALLDAYPEFREEFASQLEACREAVGYAAGELRKAELEWKPDEPSRGEKG
ncbi:MAG: tetratricopeptide repeat protein [Limisphaerales bacterium]